jgi:hypothetical protein
MKKRTQCEKILAYMKKGRTLTPLQALRKFNCLRLAGRIDELKRDGYMIKSRKIAIRGKRVARYLLVR